MQFSDNLNILGRKRVEGVDYDVLDDTFVIYNVPLIAELVQPYHDGYAFKPAEEIFKVEVDNFPLTMLADEPAHPAHLEGMGAGYKGSVTVGYMSEPTKLHAGASDKKRYADYVFYKMPRTKLILDQYIAGKNIDTSIGFNFSRVDKKGTHQGVKYDYVQTNIRLDHNAILMDAEGNKAEGRMPSPIGGIGADSMKKSKDAFEGDINELVTKLQNENPKLARKDVLNLVSNAIWELREGLGDKKTKGKSMTNDETLQKQLDKMTVERDEAVNKLDAAKDAEREAVMKEAKEAQDALTAEKDALNEKLTKAQADLKESTDKLKVFLDKEKEEINAMRDALKNANKGMEELFDGADDALIKKYHDELQKKQVSRDVGTDLAGLGGSQVVGEAKKTSSYIANLSKKEK